LSIAILGINKAMSNEALSNFIKDLDSLSEKNKTKLTVPSQGKSYNFSLFNVQQHKSVLKTAFEGFTGVIKSNNIYNDILKDNCEEPVEFSLADRSYVLLGLRKESLSNNYIVDDERHDLNKLPEPSFDFKYEDVLEYNGITVEVVIPTLARDTAINKKLISELSKLTDNKKEKETLNMAVTHEVVKFIKSVKLGDNIFVFDDFNIYESKKLVESLPLKLNNEVLLWIGEFKKKEEKNLTLEDGTIVEIDASFLASD
tara:strand:- start:2546 stop:3316 length:771 start_codon:yes stop_codon:yes gene_type:complete